MKLKYYLLLGFFCFLLVSNSDAQSRLSRKFRHRSAKNQCKNLFKKKYTRSHKVSKRKAKKETLASAKKTTTSKSTPSKKATKPTPKPKTITETTPVKPKPVPPPSNHYKPVDVNTLPAPVSEKHARIRKEVAEKLKNIDHSKPINIEPLYFVTGKAEFSYFETEPFLTAVEYAIQGKIVFVEGHTDDRGTAESNIELSMKRVERIKKLMHDYGVPDTNISVIGYGESQPKYDNNTSEGRQGNRRVDFTVY